MSITKAKGERTMKDIIGKRKMKGPNDMAYTVKGKVQRKEG